MISNSSGFVLIGCFNDLEKLDANFRRTFIRA